MSYFYRVLEHILLVARSVLQAAEKLYKLRMQVMYTDIECSLLAGFLYRVIDFARSLFYCFLDTRRMYTSVYDELFEAYPCYLSSYRIEA